MVAILGTIRSPLGIIVLAQVALFSCAHSLNLDGSQEVLSTIREAALGINLAVESVAASIRYSDGTESDIIELPTSPEYEQVMRQCIREATSARGQSVHSTVYSSRRGTKEDDPGVSKGKAPRSRPSTEPHHGSGQDQQISSDARSCCSCPENQEQARRVLGTALANVKSAIDNKVEIRFARISLATPSITALDSPTLKAALQFAGFEAALSNLTFQSASAATVAKILSTPSETQRSTSEYTTLTLEYHLDALVMTLSVKDGSIAPISTWDEAAGANAMNEHVFVSDTAYWSYVKQAIQQLQLDFDQFPIDMVVASTFRAEDDARFRRVVTEVFENVIIPCRGAKTAQRRPGPIVVFLNGRMTAAQGASSWSLEADGSTVT